MIEFMTGPRAVGNACAVAMILASILGAVVLVLA